MFDGFWRHTTLDAAGVIRDLGYPTRHRLGLRLRAVLRAGLEHQRALRARLVTAGSLTCCTAGGLAARRYPCAHVLLTLLTGQPLPYWLQLLLAVREPAIGATEALTVVEEDAHFGLVHVRGPPLGLEEFTNRWGTAAPRHCDNPRSYNARVGGRTGWFESASYASDTRARNMLASLHASNAHIPPNAVPKAHRGDSARFNMPLGGRPRGRAAGAPGMDLRTWLVYMWSCISRTIVIDGLAHDFVVGALTSDSIDIDNAVCH